MADDGLIPREYYVAINGEHWRAGRGLDGYPTQLDAELEAAQIASDYDELFIVKVTQVPVKRYARSVQVTADEIAPL